MSKQKNNRVKKIVLMICMIITFFFLSLIVTFTIFYHKYELDIEQLTSVNNGIKVYSSSMVDNTLYNTNRSIVDIDSLPDYVTDAFIDTEDKRFYSHDGYDMKRIIKATLVNLTSGSKSQGASTISQQLIKNALLSNEKTYSRKLKELILSIKMEKQFSKQEILEMYLNTIYFGSNAYGIENASQIYFNKSAKDLTLNEACCLAGIIKAPNLYSPKNNIENCIKRRNLVANLMLNAGDIDSNEYDTVINSDIVVSNNTILDTAYEEEAILEACRLLNLTERELINKKYEIITFKDDDLQEQVIDANNLVVNTHNDLDSVSIVAGTDGKIRAFYINSNYNLHNIRRQPASTLKPLAVYLPCITYNILTPASQILDEPVDYSGYRPSNHDGLYHGYVSTREAIIKSLNIPAVKALDSLGIDRSVETLTRLGINIEKSDQNLSLALGGVSGVKLLDLLSAYSTVANMGTYKGLSFVDKIIDENGITIYSHSDYNKKVLDEASCYILTDMLKDTATKGTARRLNSLNIPIASKTGTAFNGTHNTDLYNVAYTSEHTILTWIANIKDNYIQDNLHSAVEPTEINRSILDCLYKDKKPNDFNKPETVKLMPYDLLELEENHTVVAPTTNLERYIAYDYFKIDSAPQVLDYQEMLNLDVSLAKNGAQISFNTRKNREYTIFKETENGTKAVQTVKEHAGEYSLLDEDVFGYNCIKYYLIEGDNQSEIIEIRPKDYLINMLNIEMLSNKRKWYV